MGTHTSRNDVEQRGLVSRVLVGDIIAIKPDLDREAAIPAIVHGAALPALAVRRSRLLDDPLEPPEVVGVLCVYSFARGVWRFG